MPKLTIDRQEIEVPKGTKVIAAAEAAGIMIPRFCYHPALGAVGACRICAVNFKEGPVKGVQMSCMVEAQDGMVVTTDDPESADFRRQVIEWLMINHPHDCPVCDEGGMCLLQDMTVSSGHSLRRYPGKKRTYRDQYLGEFIQHEMNRCIHCWRCRRFYQEFAGYADLGAMQIGDRTFFGRYEDGMLESPFSGNLTDICPVGVYTDKPSRYQGRRWHYERGPTICLHCSLGCNLIGNVYYREMMFLEARCHPAVNGHFICDRGRYGFSYVNRAERPRHPRIAGREVSWQEALSAAAERLERIRQDSGPGSIAGLSSPRSSLENQALLRRICREQGWPGPAFFATPSLGRKVRTAVSRLEPGIALSLGQVARADFILVAAADPINEAPMLAFAMRQAFRSGAAVAVLDPRPVSLPFPFRHFPAPPGEIDLILGRLLKSGVERTAAEGLGESALRFYDSSPSVPLGEDRKTDLEEMGRKLRESRRPVLICGTEVADETTPGRAADWALLLRAEKDGAGLFYILPAGNAFGAALLDGEGSLEQLLEGVEQDRIKALVVVESDPYWSFPDRKRWQEALGRLEFLLVLDYLPSPTAREAHIFLPTLSLFETEAGFVNQEGRLQFSTPLFRSGLSVRQTGGGGHPPRVFRENVPGGEPRPAWKALAGIFAPAAGSSGLESLSDLWGKMTEEIPALAGGRPLPGRREDIRLPAGGGRPFSPGPHRPPSPGGLELLTVDWTFGTEELASYSEIARPAEREPVLFLHPRDAEKLGLKEGEEAILSLRAGELRIKVELQERMAPGVLILPRHRRLNWQKGVPERMAPDRIRKAP